MPRVRYITLVAVGDKASKKAELLLKYTCDSSFGSNFEPLLFMNNVQDIIVDSVPYSVYFVDAETDDDYKTLRIDTYEKASCFLLCYSIADRQSFENISKKWCIEIRKTSPYVPIVLVGTEAEKRTRGCALCVSPEEGENLKHLIGAAAFVECSVEDYSKIDDVFIESVRSIRNRNI